MRRVCENRRVDAHDLFEVLSINGVGIKDVGIENMGSRRLGRRNPIAVFEDMRQSRAQ